MSVEDRVLRDALMRAGFGLPEALTTQKPRETGDKKDERKERLSKQTLQGVSKMETQTQPDNGLPQIPTQAVKEASAQLAAAFGSGEKLAGGLEEAALAGLQRFTEGKPILPRKRVDWAEVSTFGCKAAITVGGVAAGTAIAGSIVKMLFFREAEVVAES